MARAVELVENDSKFFFIFEEACVSMLPFQLINLFALFLLSENIPGNKIKLKGIINSLDWNRFCSFT